MPGIDDQYCFYPTYEESEQAVATLRITGGGCKIKDFVLALKFWSLSHEGVLSDSPPTSGSFLKV